MLGKHFHRIGFRMHSLDIVALHLHHALSDVVDLFLDQEKQVSFTETCVRAKTDKVVREIVDSYRDVCFRGLAPSVVQGEAVSADEREPGR